MFLEKVRLEAYAGLKRGSDLDYIEIDFTKQKHKICFIIGKNKGGKSTLQSALHPLPDSNSCFIDGIQGRKWMRYRLNDGSIVELDINHPVNNKGERGQTKASFHKGINGQLIELNPNGNIGSYKDLLEVYFGLDANFEALSRLSTEDRGIVDKSPAERKKLAANILDNLEVFNNIGKAMSKRVTTLKSMINSITNKMDSIGNRENLELTLENINSSISLKQDEINRLLKEQNKFELMIDNLDPDKRIIDKYNNLIEALNIINKDISEIEAVLLSNKYGITNMDTLYDFIKAEHKASIDRKIELEKEEYNINAILPSILAEHEEEARTLELKKQRLDSLQSENNYSEIKKRVKIFRDSIKEYEALFRQMNIKDPLSISKDEYIQGLNVLREIKDSIDILRKASMDRNIIYKSVEYLESGYNLVGEMNSLDMEIDELTNRRADLITKSLLLESDVKRIDILKDRPKQCKIDDCAFISDLVNISKTNPISNLEKTNEEIDRLYKEIKTLKNKSEGLVYISQYMNHLRVIKRDIDMNKLTLSKLPNYEMFSSLKQIVDSVITGEDFGVMDDIYKTIVNANIFDSYRETINTLNKLEADIKIYDSKVDILNELYNDITKLNEKTKETVLKLDELSSRKKLIVDKLSSLSIDIERYNAIILTIERSQEKYLLKSDIENKICELKDDSEKIKKCMFSISEINGRLEILNKELRPLSNKRDDITYNLRMLAQYEAELKELSDKFTISEVVKYHSVPGSGIQIIFMKMYMNKTLRMANEIISSFFDGELYLNQYIIDDNEFRIPCFDKKSGITNNDISKCSSSEKCMLGMIIGYSLLRQSGDSDYDILRLDEIDAGLDQANRLSFPIALQKMIDIFGISQCIIISHNAENELSNVDLIKLSQPSSMVSTANGNVIYEI